MTHNTENVKILYVENVTVVTILIAIEYLYKYKNDYAFVSIL